MEIAERTRYNKTDFEKSYTESNLAGELKSSTCYIGKM